MNSCLYFLCSLIIIRSLLQALDTFNAAIVSPIYYVMFTTLAIIASAIMFKVYLLIYSLKTCFWCRIMVLLIRTRKRWVEILFCIYPWQDWSGQNVSSIASEICGFITVLSGTIILHATREEEPSTAPGTNNLWFFTIYRTGCHICDLGLPQTWPLTTKFDYLPLGLRYPNFLFGYYRIPSCLWCDHPSV